MINNKYYIALLVLLKEEIAKKTFTNEKKRMLQGKRFGSNEEVILETEVYFEAKDKSF